MASTSDNNKRIAKNTLMLYFRMIFLMLVSLYTSRVVLNALGVEDYGIYNVVGGIVTMFSFITSTMASASQRFLSYDLAKNDPVRLRQTFSLVVLSYIILIVITIVLSESIAVWFLNTKMNIPAERLNAANWVLQFSIFSFVMNILSAPYMAVIISRERMGVYAYASIVEAVLKLLIVYMLTVIAFDKLKVYAVLMFLSTVSITTFYRIYCKRKFPESHYSFFYDGKRLRELCSFAAWNIIGAVANVLRSQGLNILLNLFFNPAINAARGIAYQVNSAVTNFSNNFYTAVRPQLTKNFAANKIDDLLSLGLNSSRYAYYLILLLSVPILIETEEILVLWLKLVPDYTVIFVRITLVQSILEVLAMPLTFMLQAAGKIKGIQLSVSILYLLNIPISYLLLKQGMPPTIVFYVNMILVAISFIPRLVNCKIILKMSVLGYFRRVISRIAVSTALIICWIFLCLNYNVLHSHVLINICIHILITFVIIACLGINNKERVFVKQYIKKKIKYDRQT